MTKAWEINEECNTLYGIILKPYFALLFEVVLSLVFQTLMVRQFIPLFMVYIYPWMKPIIKPINKAIIQPSMDWMEQWEIFKPPQWAADYRNWQASQESAERAAIRNSNLSLSDRPSIAPSHANRRHSVLPPAALGASGGGGGVGAALVAAATGKGRGGRRGPGTGQLRESTAGKNIPPSNATLRRQKGTRNLQIPTLARAKSQGVALMKASNAKPRVLTGKPLWRVSEDEEDEVADENSGPDSGPDSFSDSPGRPSSVPLQDTTAAAAVPQTQPSIAVDTTNSNNASGGDGGGGGGMENTGTGSRSNEDESNEEDGHAAKNRTNSTGSATGTSSSSSKGMSYPASLLSGSSKRLFALSGEEILSPLAGMGGSSSSSSGRHDGEGAASGGGGGGGGGGSGSGSGGGGGGVIGQASHLAKSMELQFMSSIHASSRYIGESTGTGSSHNNTTSSGGVDENTSTSASDSRDKTSTMDRNSNRTTTGTSRESGEGNSSSNAAITASLHQDADAIDAKTAAYIEMAISMMLFLKFQMLLVICEFWFVFTLRFLDSNSGWQFYTNVYGFMTNSALISIVFTLSSSYQMFDPEHYDKIYFWNYYYNDRALKPGDICTIDMKQYQDESNNIDGGFAVWYRGERQNFRSCRVEAIHKEYQVKQMIPIPRTGKQDTRTSNPLQPSQGEKEEEEEDREEEEEEDDDFDESNDEEAEEQQAVITFDVVLLDGGGIYHRSGKSKKGSLSLSDNNNKSGDNKHVGTVATSSRKSAADEKGEEGGGGGDNEEEWQSGQRLEAVLSRYIHPPIQSVHLNDALKSISQDINSITIMLLVFSVPVVITHLIPAIFIYFWMVIIMLFGVVLLLFLIFLTRDCFCGEVDDTDKVTLRGRINRMFNRTVNSLISRLFLVFFVQTLFNYMALFYYSPTNYIDNIGTEYTLRTQTQCYYYQSLDSAEGSLVFFSWL